MWFWRLGHVRESGQFLPSDPAPLPPPPPHYPVSCVLPPPWLLSLRGLSAPFLPSAFPHSFPNWVVLFFLLISKWIDWMHLTSEVGFIDYLICFVLFYLDQSFIISGSAVGVSLAKMQMQVKIFNSRCCLFSLIDATHRDVDVLLLLSNSAYYVA